MERMKSIGGDTAMKALGECGDPGAEVLDRQLDSLEESSPELHAALTLLGASLAQRAVLTLDDPVPLRPIAIGSDALASGFQQRGEDPRVHFLSGSATPEMLGTLVQPSLADPLWWIHQDWALNVVGALIRRAARERAACGWCTKLQRLLERQAMIDFVVRGKITEVVNLKCCQESE